LSSDCAAIARRAAPKARPLSLSGLHVTTKPLSVRVSFDESLSKNPTRQLPKIHCASNVPLRACRGRRLKALREIGGVVAERNAFRFPGPTRGFRGDTDGLAGVEHETALAEVETSDAAITEAKRKVDRFRRG
jgi:hypothetical protein